MPRLVLIGGGEIESTNLDQLHNRILSEYGKRILVISWTIFDATQRTALNASIKDHFLALGATIEFANFPEDAVVKMQNADCIYIPDGDVNLLLAKLFEARLPLNDFNGTIIGNGAGAIALCTNALITKGRYNPKTEIVRGEGLFDFCIEPHFDNTNNQELRILSARHHIYAIPECCALVVEKNPEDGSSPEMNSIGTVFQYKHGRKSAFRNAD